MAINHIDGIDTSDEQGGGESELESALSLALAPQDANFATNEKVQQWAKYELNALCQDVRNQRMSLNEQWREIVDMVHLQHNERQAYVGYSNAYIPLYARNRQTLISSFSRGLFPSDEYLDATVHNEMAEDVRAEDAKAAKLYLQWEVETNAKFRTRVKEFLGQFIDFGTGVLKVRYEKDPLTVGKLLGGEEKFQPRGLDGLRVNAVNIFDWYVYPNTISSLDEAVLVFEDITVTRAYIEDMVRSGKWVKNAVELCESAQVVDVKESNEVNALIMEFQTAPKNLNASEKNGKLYDLVEAWVLCTQFPKAAYALGEEVGTAIPVRIVMTSAGDIVSARRNPYFHQKPPYLVARHNTMPGSFYGYGYGKLTLDIQALVNDFANQGNDVGIYSLNPIGVSNPSNVIGPLPPLAPGISIYAHDIDRALRFERPPQDVVQSAQMMLNAWISMGQDFGGAPPALQGSGNKASKTATGAQILQQNAQGPIQDLVEDIENDVLVPLLEMAWSNAQQFRSQEVMAAVAGRPFKLTREQLMLNATFRWKASSQAVNAQVRAQQAIQLIQATAGLVPILQQQGKEVHFEALIEKIYSDGFGFRGFDRFIQPMQQQPMQPGGAPGMPPMQGPPGAQGPEGDRMRSATEQAANGGIEAQPGEAQEFMNVRGQADDLAAMLGAMGGIPGGE